MAALEGEVEGTASETEVSVTYQGNTVSLVVSVANTISDLKESIVQNGSFDLEKEKMVLLDGSNPLEDSRSLSSFSIIGSGVLKLELVVLLEVRLNRGERDRIVVLMEINETVADLKAKLFEQYHIPVGTQRLKQAWATLADAVRLSSLGTNGTANYVELQLDVRFSLRLEVFTGVSFELEVSDNEQVDTLYAEVNRQARVPYHRQEIVYGDRVLEVGARINQYNVPDQATLLVNLRNYQVMVFLKTLTGQTIMLTVTPRDTVAQVKAMVEQQEGIPVAKQRLIFVGNQLHDDHYFLDYRIEHESAVHLVIREGNSFEVHVRAPSGRSHVFEVNPGESVDQLKTKLRDREGIPCEIQQFFHNGQLLESNRSLLECNVISGSTLRLAIDQGRSTQIFVSLQRDTFPLWVNGNYTVLRVKEMIAEKKGIATELQQIFFARTPLENDRTLRHYTIETNHMLHVNVVYPPTLHFTVTLQGRESRPIECEERANMNIQDLKSILSVKFNTSATQQLFFEGSELEDSQKLSDCGVSNGSNLDLIFSSASALPTKAASNSASGAVLFVKTLTGKTVMVQVNLTDTVLALKEQIRDKEGVEVAHQCLVCGGKVLENQATVSECGMQNQSMLHLVLRVPSRGPVDLVVQAGEQRLEMTVAREDTVGSLKEQIEARTGIAVVHQTLLVEGVALEPEALISSSNVKDGTIIMVQNMSPNN